jgi:hypothetical protein
MTEDEFLRAALLGVFIGLAIVVAFVATIATLAAIGVIS